MYVCPQCGSPALMHYHDERRNTHRLWCVHCDHHTPDRHSFSDALKDLRLKPEPVRT